MGKKAISEDTAAAVVTFSKVQLVQSKRYRERRDLLTVLLEDGVEYSHLQVETLIEKFMERKAK